MQGSHLAFARTEQERQQTADPRPSLAARYATRAAWADAVIGAAEHLVAERLLLREDADRLVAALRSGSDPLEVL